MTTAADLAAAAEFDARFLGFFQGLQAKFPSDFFDFQYGKRYVKVRHACWAEHPSIPKPTKAESVYAFVDKTTGDVLKPAGYNAPAKHARGNIYKDDFGLNCCGKYSVAYLRG